MLSLDRAEQVDDSFSRFKVQMRIGKFGLFPLQTLRVCT